MSDPVQFPSELKILIIGKHWPEPNSSAAGSRMLQLIEVFRQVGNITFASAAIRNEHSVDLESLGVACTSILLNHASFDEFIQQLQPGIVMFDRFMTEEQFGWRVESYCPQAIRILDTEDLHGLRAARELAAKQNRPVSDDDYFNEVAVRELAAIYRSDLSLIISEAEMEILQRVYRLPLELLMYLPFMVDQSESAHSGFHERAHFISIGNFLHAPNRDSVHYLKSTVWPLIKAQLPEARILIYGAYQDNDVSGLDDPDNGICVKGRAEDAVMEMRNARVSLAPLRFGAGLKGKMITAMQCGTPIVTTPIGAEGINGELPWPGKVAESPQALAEAAVDLYSNERAWVTAQRSGESILIQRFHRDYWSPVFLNRLIDLRTNLSTLRKQNIVGKILHHQTLRSTEYMSRWITLKSDIADRSG